MGWQWAHCPGPQAASEQCQLKRGDDQCHTLHTSGTNRSLSRFPGVRRECQNTHAVREKPFGSIHAGQRNEELP